MSELQLISNFYIEGKRLTNESLFHVASGNLGIRGCYEEGVPSGAPSIRGTYLNAFYEKESIQYNERLFGFPDDKQQIVNLPDAQTIRIYAGDVPVVCWNGSDMVQILDMKNGVYERSFGFDTKKGTLAVKFTRMAGFVTRDVFVIRCEITSDGYDGPIRIESELKTDVSNFTDPSDPRVASGNGKLLRTVSCQMEKDILTAVSKTKNSGNAVSVAVVHDFDSLKVDACSEDGITVSSTYNLTSGSSVCFTKYCVYHSMENDSDTKYASARVLEMRKKGFDALKEEQRKYMDDFWKHSRVIIEGNDYLQAQTDYCLYSMLSSAGKDGKSNVAAKGLSGEGYEGHYFWDSEIYVFPFFLLSNPDIARELLNYRYLHLEDAKAHARRMGHPVGALYPWRTISGSECSSHYPTGSAQYHINGDIAKAFSMYYDATKDDSFLDVICEVLVETSRLWLDLGHYVNGVFCIDCVTGPDEYTCMVNNNYYTNSCAAESMKNAVRLCKELEKLGRLSALMKKTGLTDSELAAFKEAAEKMKYPYDEERKIIKQDDSFLDKKLWNLKEIPKENFPLLMHYHPLQINRCQVLKQADSVLANHLYHEESALTMMRSFDYYEQITTHDSSLSNCIYSIMAARLGNVEKAEQYFEKCVGTDTCDDNGNTKDGLHIANMGGVYKALTGGFAGVKIDENGLSLFPVLPEGFRGISFGMKYLDTRLKVNIQSNECTLVVTEGPDVEAKVYDRVVKVSKNEVCVRRKMRAVVFDLDGVITDTAKYHYLAWKQIADELGVPFDEVRNEQFKGVSRKRCLELLVEWGNLNLKPEAFEELLVRKNEIYKDMLKEVSPDSILPGIPECIRDLRAKHIPVALFSVSKNTNMILKNLQMTDAFDAIVCGDDITYSKPHFEGYMLAAERLGVDHRLCIMVEDSEAGIQGAKDISMRTVAIMKENTRHADRCVSSTKDVFKAISELL